MPLIHCACVDKQWPPAPLPSCACPTCRPPPPVGTARCGLTTRAERCYECSSQSSVSSSSSSSSSTTSSDSSSSLSRCGHVCCNRASAKCCNSSPTRFSTSASERAFESRRSCPYLTPCCGACRKACSHQCSPSFRHVAPSDSTPGYERQHPGEREYCATRRNRKGYTKGYGKGGNRAEGGRGGVAVGVAGPCVSGYFQPCMGRLCTGDESCWYCQRRKEKEQEEMERLKKCHCHLGVGSCPSDLLLVGRHHCLTCLDCMQDV